jgi:hypothetical protein
VQLKEFKEKNPQIEFEFALKRGFHPYLAATYINGFKKEYPLLNRSPDEILEALNITRSTCNFFFLKIIFLK